MKREDDIQELCKQVLEETYVTEDYNNGESYCPWCGNSTHKNDIKDIQHEGNCAYLIAKDLSTKT